MSGMATPKVTPSLSSNETCTGTLGAVDVGAADDEVAAVDDDVVLLTTVELGGVELVAAFPLPDPHAVSTSARQLNPAIRARKGRRFVRRTLRAALTSLEGSRVTAPTVCEERPKVGIRDVALAVKALS
jgi:hypothetical protein